MIFRLTTTTNNNNNNFSSPLFRRTIHSTTTNINNNKIIITRTTLLWSFLICIFISSLIVLISINYYSDNKLDDDDDNNPKSRSLLSHQQQQHVIITNTALVPLPRTFDQKQTSPNYWLETHYNLTQLANDENCNKAKVLFWGDSITARWHIPTFQNYFGIKYGALNFGIGGDRIQHVLWRLQNGEVTKKCSTTARVIVLLIGTNNIPRSFDPLSVTLKDPRNTPEEIVQGILHLVEEFKLAYPFAKILLLALLPRGDKSSPERKAVNMVNSLLAQQLQHLHEGSGTTRESRIRFLDVSQVFLDAELSVQQTMPDLLHPNNDAYTLFAIELAPMIEELLLLAGS
jgi:lysophospholipase L1-like esterase